TACSGVADFSHCGSPTRASWKSRSAFAATSAKGLTRGLLSRTAKDVALARRPPSCRAAPRPSGLGSAAPRPPRSFDLRRGDGNVVGHLQAVQARVDLVTLQQFAMRSGLDDPSVLEHDNTIGMLDGRQAMRDDDGRAAAHQFLERILDQP